MVFNQSIDMVCCKCTRTFPVSEMRYDSNGRDLVCRDCLYRKRKDDVPQPVLNKPIPPIEFSQSRGIRPTRSPSRSSQSTEDRVQYLCGRCKYKFWKVARIPALKCPNCDRTEIYVLKSERAHDILSDDFLKGHSGIDF
ncbi:hypothetical protein HY772_00195 [Candidatus Woesearchaeota archaeon]|nr:hypothetical protein [Candidatus Woesearchaeota archaeon]